MDLALIVNDGPQATGDVSRKTAPPSDVLMTEKGELTKPKPLDLPGPRSSKGPDLISPVIESQRTPTRAQLGALSGTGSSPDTSKLWASPPESPPSPPSERSPLASPSRHPRQASSRSPVLSSPQMTAHRPSQARDGHRGISKASNRASASMKTDASIMGILPLSSPPQVIASQQTSSEATTQPLREPSAWQMSQSTIFWAPGVNPIHTHASKPASQYTPPMLSAPYPVESPGAIDTRMSPSYHVAPETLAQIPAPEGSRYVAVMDASGKLSHYQEIRVEPAVHSRPHYEPAVPYIPVYHLVPQQYASGQAPDGSVHYRHHLPYAHHASHQVTHHNSHQSQLRQQSIIVSHEQQQHHQLPQQHQQHQQHQQSLVLTGAAPPQQTLAPAFLQAQQTYTPGAPKYPSSIVSGAPIARPSSQAGARSYYTRLYTSTAQPSPSSLSGQSHSPVYSHPLAGPAPTISNYPSPQRAGSHGVAPSPPVAHPKPSETLKSSRPVPSSKAQSAKKVGPSSNARTGLLQSVNEHILVLKQPGEHKDQLNIKTRQFMCQDCGRSFFRKSDLARHIQIHLGIKPNTCKVCGKQFIQRSALTVHQRVHTGEKPYSCQICDRAFSDSSSLARHRRIHSRNREEKRTYMPVSYSGNPQAAQPSTF